MCISFTKIRFLSSQKIIEATQVMLDELNGVTSVHSRFYELTSDYYKLSGDHANYYREALRFLGCIDVTQLPKERQHERAYNLSLAALLGTYVGVLKMNEDKIRRIYPTWLDSWFKCLDACIYYPVYASAYVVRTCIKTT